MTATERVVQFKQRQRAAGRKPFSTWLHPDAIRELKKRAKGATAGQVIEALLAQPVSGNAQS